MRWGSQDVTLSSILLQVLRSIVPGLVIKDVEQRNSMNVKCNSVYFTFDISRRDSNEID
jgi:hypothetical protein